MRFLKNTISHEYWQQHAPEKFRSMGSIKEVAACLRSCPVYAPSPILKSPRLAGALHIAELALKDETGRMGLGSFKALGGSYAIIRSLLQSAIALTDPASFEQLSVLGKNKTYCCASAGNHGLSVLAGANLVGARAVIFLADAVPEEFAERLRTKGAEVIREGKDYDASMRAARDACEANGWDLISDSSWPGYKDIPLLIMNGYAILTEEIAACCSKKGKWPTHVFLQAGVGGLAAGLANHIRLTWPEQPSIIVVEPEKAACILASVEANKLTTIHAPGTNMGRLDCAEPSMLAFEVLKSTADAFITITDQEADAAVSALAQDDLETTPSGAAGYAGLAAVTRAPELRKTLGLDHNARCLCIVSEGAI
ncbi:diaminopropionate ammonia-lyase [Hyphococcus flavus]|uniref:Diaminopropionate ammonia-lyase n=1 Tax=Hyphococcus flavus TaxID=1866326 RepID=A0AAE9ZHE7_9PROT|nr:diaminopropionate ammonia-lyase [Hyphococcus flavus]WDI30876.1 diaminopropionate ammonia-lyase [Hyphococcus flavus]